MAHEITTTAGKAEMAYVGETPWHGLGQQLTAGASIETWIEQAGMGWSVRKAPIFYTADRAGNDQRQDPEHTMLVRSDTGAALGIVSPSYNIVQPFEVLEFFRDLTTDAGFTLETAGTLFGGRRYWALAKVTEQKIAGWDEIGGYLLLTTSADGTFASEARETTVRVVCNNTLSMAVNTTQRNENLVRISHRAAWNPEAIKAKLGLSREHFAAFIEAANTLSKARVSLTTAEQFVTELLRPGTLDDDETSTPRGLMTILGLFDGAGLGSTQKGSKGTAWGLLNAVTEYVDHHATAVTVDHRMNRAMWGDHDKLKTRAMEKALTELA